MESLIESGLLIAFIGVLMISEAVILSRRYRTTGRGKIPRRFVFNLAAGATLMVAVQSAVWDASTALLLILLGLAGIFHLREFNEYWRGD
ncbi:MAG: hypothetical protein CBC39_03505 [Cellvibrionales bacterium TMED79]|nr:hypothetical protein [Halieaceae bacterium]OUV03797.1 MAG: hypothetical protein CBC39_03505 [Cellvibrionales bacterium TMED79]